MATKPFAVRIVEQYEDGFLWKCELEYRATTHDVALKRAIRDNAYPSRAGIVEAHGRLIDMAAAVRLSEAKS